MIHWLQQHGEPLTTRERLVLGRRFSLDGQAPQGLHALMELLDVTTQEGGQ